MLTRNNRKNGLTGSFRELSEDVFKTVAKHFGGQDKLATNEKPKIKNIAKKLKSGTPNKEGFRILMDADETSILVAGEDGYIYFAEKTEGYDLSAPWGTVNTTLNIISFDVFGRLINFNPWEMMFDGFTYVAPLYLDSPKKMPLDRRRPLAQPRNLPLHRRPA
jgi:hypothetical protein